MAKTNEPIGARIRRLRTKRGMKQNELARLAGLNPVNMNHIESGRHRPKLETIDAIAAALGVSRQVVLGEASDQAEAERVIQSNAQSFNLSAAIQAEARTEARSATNATLADLVGSLIGTLSEWYTQNVGAEIRIPETRPARSAKGSRAGN